MEDLNQLKVVLTNNAQKFVTELPFQTLTKNRVYTDIGYASVERNDEVYPLGSILPDLITEVQNDPKYQDYLK